MKTLRSLAVVSALSVAAGGCATKSSSRGVAIFGAATMATALVIGAVHDPEPPENSIGPHIDGLGLALAGTFLVGLALTVSGGLGYAAAADASKSPPPLKAAAPAVTVRERDAALAIAAARVGDCATVERHVTALRAVDPIYVNAVVLSDFFVANCLDETYRSR